MPAKRSVGVLMVAMLAAAPCAQASWLSEITGVDIDLNRGRVSIQPPKPQAVVPMIQNLPKDLSQALLNPAAPVLATAIRFSRGQALNRGTQAIPPHVRTALAPHIPPAILDRVTWTTPGGGITLDSILSGWLNQEGAVTLDDVIVFSNSGIATANTIEAITLWAHELTHVMQYQNMGVETFAFAYTTNWGGMEGQAKDNASRIGNLLRQGGSSSPQVTYNVSPGSFSQPLQWNQVNQVARQTIDPVSCIWINGGMTGNACPIPVMVSGVVMVNGMGQQFQYPCNEPTCFFPPGASGPLLSPPGFRIIGVLAAYQAF